MDPGTTQRFGKRKLLWECGAYTRASWESLREDWQALAERSAEVPVTLGQVWTGTWLEVYGDLLRPLLWTCSSGAGLHAACLLTPRRETRGPIPVRCLYLNTAGEDAGEGVCLEYNQVLCASDRVSLSAPAFGEAVHASGADELLATGATRAAVDFLRCALPGWSEDIRWSDDPYVDLGLLRRTGTEYRRSIQSRNSRAQLSQTLRAYAELGPLQVDAARTPQEAGEMLDELIALHEAAWRERALPGAFASERMRRFHRLFITRAFPGLVDLVRVTAGAETVGLLYSLVDRKRVYFYQSGLRYRDGNQYRPGIAAHACAIEHYLELGFDEYHFLAGDAVTPRYKRVLAAEARQLAWARFVRPGLKSASIRGLRALRAKFGRRQ
jgi:CelD/BcsL family acetyltransferase involved in cellulose biosynthesis